MIDFIALQTTTTELINKIGSTLTLKKPSSSTYDVSSGEIVTVDGTTTTIKAIIESYTSQEVQGLVQAGDLKIMVTHDNVIEMEKDTIILQDREYNIINVMPELQGDVILYYNVQVRR